MSDDLQYHVLPQNDPLAALDHITLAIRNFHDSGNVAYIRSALATLAVFLDRLGRYEPAATIAGFAFSPFTALVTPEIAGGQSILAITAGSDI